MKESKGGGPGTNLSGGVRRTIASPFTKGSNMGSQVGMSGPFGEHGRSGGDNGLPTRVMDPMGGMAKGPTPGSPFQAPSSQGPNRAGTSQFKYGKK